MTFLFSRLSRLAEFIAAMALAAVFVVFLVQIFSRYAAKIAWLMPIPSISNWMSLLEPIGWTVNLISLLWVWIVFFGAAFIVRSRDHVTFDVLYLAMSHKTRRIMAILSAIGLLIAMVYSFPAMWDLVFANRLMELKKIQTLSVPFTGDKIPMKWLFAPYVLLMVSVIARALWQIVYSLRFGAPETAVDAIVSDATGDHS